MSGTATADERARIRPLQFAAVASLLALSACVGDEPVVGGGQGGRTTPRQASGTAAPSPTVAPVTPGRASSGDPVIAAAGDIACNIGVPGETTCRHRATSDVVVAGSYDRVLVLGDNAYEDGTLNDFRTYFDPTWGRVKRRIRPVPGNHEYQTQGARGYFRYFGKAAGPRGQGYYSFDIGTWHVVALNSNCGEVSCAEGSDQQMWLRADLSGNDSACTLAFWHHPRWSSGVTHGGNDDVAPLVTTLYEFGAEVLLVGHEHNYERFAPQTPKGRRDTKSGIRQFVVGTGGKDHHPFGTPVPNSEVRNSETYGVLQLTLHPRSYQWRFVPEKGKSFTDSGRTNCH